MMGVSARAPPKLEGQVCWVVGGVGSVGAGLVRGFLRAGATVIVNSRFPARLEQLREELGAPEKLVAINSSLLPGHAEGTIQQAMELTAGRIDHVIAHSAVRWWGMHGPSKRGEAGILDEAYGPPTATRILDLTTEDYVASSTQLPSLHHCVARQLLPRLLGVPGSSYTFVTGGGNEDARSAIGQVNAQAVWGLAAALRNELRESEVKLREVRVGLKFNRKREERLADPRETPLSHDLGAICAGIAASAERGQRPPHAMDSKEDCDFLKARFPVADQGYAVYFRSADVL